MKYNSYSEQGIDRDDRGYHPTQRCWHCKGYLKREVNKGTNTFNGRGWITWRCVDRCQDIKPATVPLPPSDGTGWAEE